MRKMLPPVLMNPWDDSPSIEALSFLWCMRVNHLFFLPYYKARWWQKWGWWFWVLINHAFFTSKNRQQRQDPGIGKQTCSADDTMSITKKRQRQIRKHWKKGCRSGESRCKCLVRGHHQRLASVSKMAQNG